jgi:hypothetical protein
MQSIGVESTPHACDPDQCSPLASLHTRGFQRTLADLAIRVMWLDGARRDTRASLVEPRALVDQMARRRHQLRVWCNSARTLHKFGCPLRAALFGFERALASYSIEHESFIEAAIATLEPA